MACCLILTFVILTFVIFPFEMHFNDAAVQILYYIYLFYQIESKFHFESENIMIWAYIIGTIFTQMAIRMSVIQSFVNATTQSPLFILSRYTLLMKVYGPLLNAACLSAIVINFCWKAILNYESYFHHFCFAFGIDYPFQMEFAISNLNHNVFLVSWVQTAIKYKIHVVEYAVQVNEIFVGKVHEDERGFLLTDLEPNETYRVRIWCLTRPNMNWYPSR